MRRAVPILMLAATMVVVACGEESSGVLRGDGDGEAEQLNAGVLAFEPDGAARVSGGAVAGEPIDPAIAFGWMPPPGTSTPPVGPAGPDGLGTVYVAVAGRSGCQLATGAELWREGNDLQARFTGGEAEAGVDCVRSHEPYVQFAVDGDLVGGATTFEGEPLVDPAGPGRLLDFVVLADLRPVPVVSVELGTDEADTLADDLQGMLPAGSEDVLEPDVPEGSSAFAFVLIGCQETGAGLVITSSEIDAKLTGGEDVDCVAPVYFLAVLQVADEELPAGAELAE